MSTWAWIVLAATAYLIVALGVGRAAYNVDYVRREGNTTGADLSFSLSLGALWPLLAVVLVWDGVCMAVAYPFKLAGPLVAKWWTAPGRKKLAARKGATS